MNSNEDLQITEIGKLNFNENRFSKKKINKNLLLLILIILILFIINDFYFFFFKRNINHIINFNYSEKTLNQEIIKKLKLIETKFKKLEQEELSKINNYNNFNIYYLLYIKEVKGYKKIRIGNKRDGGYILLNDFKNIKIGYSFGISREISFDKGLADKNIDVFMYDHTIEKLPFENPKFHWKKIGLTGRNINKNNMKTLSELIKDNGHSNEKNMILKMDIESYEWEVFQYLPINNMRQFNILLENFISLVQVMFNIIIY